MIFFVPMCRVSWHMGTGQRAVPLEPALWHPLFFLTFSLSAQCVRHFAPISINLGSEPTKLTLVVFSNIFFKKKKNSLEVLNDRTKYPPRHCLLIRSALFYVLVEFFQQRKLFFAVFWWFFFVPICQIFWHMGTGQRAVPLEPALWHPLFFFDFQYNCSMCASFRAYFH